MTDYIDVLNRIKRIYSSSSPEEQKILLKILEEIRDNGDSKTYEELWLADYKEIPVDKYTFLTDSRFLGNSNNNGKSIYPAWMDVMMELERTGNQYYEIVFTGATRTGKSSTAVSDACYQLYKLMCLRNPQEYFSLKAVTQISIFFFNLTATLAKGVAFKEFNSTLATSPYFLEHGHFTDSEQNPVYIPDGGLIEIKAGSDSSHALGQATYCVIGSTKILTDRGVAQIRNLEGIHKVGQYTPSGDVIFVDAEIKCTGHVDKTVSLVLDDGSVVEGTSSHKFLLQSGQYRALCAIEPGDVLQSTTQKSGLKVVEKINVSYTGKIPVYDVINAAPFHNFIVCDNSSFVAHNCVVFDEVNFASAGIKDISKSKARMKAKYDTLVARVTGTFVRNGEVFGKIYVISSKNSDSDFMEEYIEQQKKAGNPHMYIFDRPQWEVWPKSKYSSDKMFKIALGGKKLKSFVVPDDTPPQGLLELEDQGYKLLDVPEDNKTRFLADFDIALRDIAGISVPGTLSYITQDIIDRCIGTNRNPFFNEILQIGTKDNYSIEEYFHDEVVDKRIKMCPMFIHLDLSLSTDRTGISCVAITGRKDIESESNKISMPTFTHVFSLALEAPRGDKIPYDKITSFICTLRKMKYNIQKITRDQFQSEYMAQLLEAQGFNVDKISLDRTPDGYTALKSVLLEERIDMLDCNLLQDELIHLQRDAGTGKIDHPAGGCFTGDTKVRLWDGRALTIYELINEQNDFKQNYVYTVNEETLKIEIKLIQSVHKTKEVPEFMWVHLSNERSISCTPDHKFMLPDGTYEEIQNLPEGTELMTLSENFNWVHRTLEPVTVVSKEVIPLRNTPVYDLTIDGNPNFALDAGVFVHNSKDVSDSFAGAVWDAVVDNPGIPMASKKIANVMNRVNTPTVQRPQIQTIFPDGRYRM